MRVSKREWRESLSVMMRRVGLDQNEIDAIEESVSKYRVCMNTATFAVQDSRYEKGFKAGFKAGLKAGRESMMPGKRIMCENYIAHALDRD